MSVSCVVGEAVGHGGSRTRDLSVTSGITRVYRLLSQLSYMPSR